MSTNSRIGYQRADGSIRSVYVHWDGYPTGVGATLVKNHNNAVQALRLISLGDISTLADTDGTLSPRGDEKSNGIISYRRWRREADVAPRKAANELEYAKDGDYCGAEYLYLFRRGYGWFVAVQPERDTEPVFVPLAGLLLDTAKAETF